MDFYKDIPYEDIPYVRWPTITADDLRRDSDRRQAEIELEDCRARKDFEYRQQRYREHAERLKKERACLIAIGEHQRRPGPFVRWWRRLFQA